MSRPARRADPAPWGSLSRFERKRRLIKIKNDLRESSPYFRGLFHTPHSLRPGTLWIDLVFLSRKRPGDYYNATLACAVSEFSEALDSLAWAIVAPTIDDYPSAAQKSAAMAQARSIALEREALFSRERVELDFTYTDGVGLRATVNEPCLTPEAVERFINAFLDGGEMSWRSETPLSWAPDALPPTDFTFALPAWAEPLEEPWARELLARNRAFDERQALIAGAPARGPAAAPPRSL